MDGTVYDNGFGLAEDIQRFERIAIDDLNISQFAFLNGPKDILLAKDQGSVPRGGD